MRRGVEGNWGGGVMTNPCERLEKFITNETKAMKKEGYPDFVIVDTIRDFYSGDNPICRECYAANSCLKEG
jgi:RecA-family ATPase